MTKALQDSFAVMTKFHFKGHFISARVKLKENLKFIFDNSQYFQCCVKSFFVSICPPPGFLPVLGLLEGYMTPTLDTAWLYSHLTKL